MARRGFFAELHYQAQQAEKRRRQQVLAAERAQAAAQREADQARVRAERADAAAKRASAAQQKEAQKLAAQMRAEARMAEVAALNADLAERYAEIDGILQATLATDDYVDLESMKITSVAHPPFEPGPLAIPATPLPPPVYPPEPVYQEPAAPRGLSGALGGKKRHAEAVALTRADYEGRLQLWQHECARVHSEYVATEELRQRAEQDRLAKLSAAEATHREQCREREASAAAHNQNLAQFINDLAFDVESAIQDYVGVVLSNSIYPDSFRAVHDHTFDLSSRELTLHVTVPEPGTVPVVKEYRYVRSKDEISSSTLTVREQKERYANAVWQVAVRTFHEIFEADRAGKIYSVALTVVTNRIAPTTGLPEEIPLVIAAAERKNFATFDLAKIIPQATLVHLGAALSKSPFDLAPADTRTGVRVRSE